MSYLALIQLVTIALFFFKQNVKKKSTLSGNYTVLFKHDHHQKCTHDFKLIPENNS